MQEQSDQSTATELLWQKFVNWEIKSRDSIDFKKIYVDMAEGDILAGLVLSELIYWNLPDASGTSRLRVIQNGIEWVACTRFDWWDRCRLSPREFDRASRKLIELKLIVKEYFIFAGVREIHIRVRRDVFYNLWNFCLNAPIENPYEKQEKERSKKKRKPTHRFVTTSDDSPIRESIGGRTHQNGDPITESTYTESTKEKDSLPDQQIEKLSDSIEKHLGAEKDSDDIQSSEKDSVPKNGTDVDAKPLSDSASACVSETPTEPEKTARPRNPIFDAVAEQVFGITSAEELRLMNAKENSGSRIGDIASWLEKKRDFIMHGKKKVQLGFISAPAKPEHVKMFMDDYRRENENLKLRDAEKFVEYWRAWASKRKASPGNEVGSTELERIRALEAKKAEAYAAEQELARRYHQANPQ